jgi:diguanylate cyclase (GGDEF)-like protein
MSAHLARPPIEELRADARAAARDLRNGEQALLAMIGELEREKDRASDAFRAIVRSLAAALEARDGYTGGHSDEVQEMAVRVAVRLRLPPAAVEEVRTVALLHDVGKIGVPDGVLHKNGPLSAEEWELMRRHPIIGERILRPLPGMAAVADAVRHEHERWDGSGYPDGIRGDAIPLASRVVLACDAWHAMVSDRPYRPPLGPEAARAELLANAGRQFDPDVVEALLASLDDPAPAPSREPGEPGEPGDEGARPERELHALLTVAAAVAGAHGLDDVLEVAAEAALEALGAASLSISHWDRPRDELRTLINVGELGPGEERRPRDEIYLLSDYPELLEMLLRGRPHRAAVDDPDAERHEVQLLHELGKASSVAVPIVFGGESWGEMYATRAYGRPPFAERDVRFLEAICGQVAAAVGRAELFSELSELAYRDPLTGHANRRAFDERLERAVVEAHARDVRLALIIADLDGLKDINDARGHAAGDRALVAVGQALAQVSALHPAAFVARLGGDEFGMIVPLASAERARELAERALELLGDAAGSMSAGVAALEPDGRATDLMRAADAALYAAKRTGRDRVVAAGGPELEEPPAPAGERRARRGAARLAGRLTGLVQEAMAALDRVPADATAERRLRVVLLAAAAALDAPAVALSWHEAGSPWIETVLAIDLGTGRDLGDPLERLEAAAYPASVRIATEGGALHADAQQGAPAERALVAEMGFEGLLAVGAPAGRGGWLLEVFADARTLPLAPAAAPLRALAAVAAAALRGR